MRKVRFHSLLCPFESLAIVIICCLKVLCACRLHRYCVIYNFNSLQLNFLVQGTASTHQHVWNSIVVQSLASSLVDSASDALPCAHLLACSATESGAWLNVIPNASLGLQLDDEMFGLQLVSGLVSPCVIHICFGIVGPKWTVLALMV